MTTGVVGVVCALQSEARHLGPISSRHASVAQLADGKLLSVAGMGGAAATVAARNLLAAGAGALLSFGMAGGLDPKLPAGTIFIAREVVAADGTAFASDPGWTEQVRGALAARHVLSGGRLLSETAAVTTIARKAALLRATGAAAVDMESLAVAQVAHAQGVPFIAVRVIVDVATDALPDSVRGAADAQGQVRLARLLGQLLVRPGDVVPLLRLSRRYRDASRALAALGRSGALTAHAVSRP